MRIHRDLFHLSEASAGRAHLTMDARQQARLGFDTDMPQWYQHRERSIKSTEKLIYSGFPGSGSPRPAGQE